MIKLLHPPVSNGKNMTPEELKKIISQKENPKLDFKREYKLDKTPPENTNKQRWIQFVNGQWDEFIKDILALTNGNIGIANQEGLLIIGVDDNLYPDGTRVLYDTSYLNLTEQQILEKVNGACSPPVPNIQFEKVILNDKTICIITISPSPYLHETTRELQIMEGHFNADGCLTFVQPKSHYTAHTVFIRRGDNIFPASKDERYALEKEKESILISQNLNRDNSKIIIDENQLITALEQKSKTLLKWTQTLKSARRLG